MSDLLIDSRVCLEYHDQNELFAQHLPVEGAIKMRLTTRDGAEDWYLVELDRSIEYQHSVGGSNNFKRIVAPKVLVRSRWHGEPISSVNSPSVFMLLVSDSQMFEQDQIETEDYYFVCWAKCRVLDAQ